jgi:CCR4-NOT transcription complex subunit 1
MAMLKLLVELYNAPNIIQEIKFEVEILTNVLDVEISSVTPSTLLKNKKAYGGPGRITDFDSLPEDPNSERQPKFHVQYVHINPNLQLFRQQPQLKKAVYISINKAIQDVIAPVVDRLVMIASITTRELTVKDFAMEPDESKMLKAAGCMVQSLAGNLASITCKDPLRAAITNNLRTTLGVPPGKPIPAHLEHAIQTVVAENLELACSVVQVRTFA